MAYKLSRKVALGAKTETAQGTAVVPAQGTDYILVNDVDVKVGTERLEREYKRSNLDPLGSVTGKRWSEITFTTECKYNTGSLATLIRACGFSASLGVTSSFTPVSDASNASNFNGPGDSCTIEVYKDGLKHIVEGALGSFKVNAEAGKFATMEFSFKGEYTAVADTGSMPTPTLDTTQPPIAQLAELVIQSYSPCVGKIDFDVANEVTMIDCINATNAVQGFMITGRKPVGNFDPLAVTVATHDFFGNLISGAEAAGSFKLAGTKTVEFNFAGVQYNDVAYGDKNGLMTFSVPLKFTGTGNNWLTLKMY